MRADRLQDAAQWCADLLNYQLVPAILRWNYGDETEPPTIVPDLAVEPDPKAKADRDQVLAAMGLPLPTKYLYSRHNIPEPEAGEETLSVPVASPFGFPPPGGVSSGLAAPGGGGPQATADSAADRSDPSDPSQPSAQAAESSYVNPPRSAVGRGGESDQSPEVRAQKSEAILPGAYEPPASTQRALAEAHARDFAPLHVAAEPLLSAIEGGNLAVVGELEIFIARLDELAPGMVGASELADTLEAALAEAAISGAAQSYGKLEGLKD